MQRRDFLKNSIAVASISIVASSFLTTSAYASEVTEGEEAITISFEDAYSESIGINKVEESDIVQLNIPDAPENAILVPVEVNVDYPMEADNYIKAIYVLSTANKVNKAIKANYTPANGKAYLYTNIKLGKTQDVVVLAENNKGVIYKASKKIKIAASGCGG